ncbi:uncharacterized protein LOC133799864 [Humulus lupulus]|uniref:uncharacterized protein LOC133799864 n=1 Tax=Humulus lupulus TaxID=3486 RepID=UPI002B40A932|nr:uncharacterized protein LOC133799864 [Humulus lupulus]
MKVQDEKVTFNVFKPMRYLAEIEDCSLISVVDSLAIKFLETSQHDDPLEIAMLYEPNDDEEEEFLAWLEASSQGLKTRTRFEPLELSSRAFKVPKPSIEEPPKLELKALPSHLRYAFMGPSSKLPVIISGELSAEQEGKLLDVLRQHKKAIGWTIDNIWEISPSLCMHKILLEDDKKGSIKEQRKLCPIMKEVVKKEIIKWLDAVQCVPKKGRMTVVQNEDNELIPTRTVAGWRICLDYCKLNNATRKDHFPLPFMDQMLDRLARRDYYCFLDGYSDYNKISVARKDLHKTTFTCPYGTFAFRSMPFGLCNAPATFQSCMMAIFSDMVEKFLEVFIDDFSVFGDSYDECLSNLAKVLNRCEKTNIVLN